MKRLFTIQALSFLLFCPLLGFGFDLTVTQTNETCPGNGSLTFSITNPAPGGSIMYVIYKLPNLSTPYSSGTSTTVNGLTAGDYRIIARETVGTTTTTQQRDLTITSSYTPLTYTVQALNQACSTTSSISVLVNSGIAATYAIIDGPLTFPAQASNTFSGLPVGIYKVRVIDACGNSVVQTFTVTLNPTSLTIGNPVLSNTDPPCNAVIVTNTITAATGTVIGYPLSIQYVLHLPSGINTIQTVLNSGDPSSQPISLTVPYQVNQTYTYDVIITDACGMTYPTDTFVLNNNIKFSVDIEDALCNNHFFGLNVSQFVNSYTLQFITTPAGFNPATFNSNYPGPFTQPRTDFGDDALTVPFGDYKVTITDSCGKTRTIQFSIIDEPPVPTITGASNGCLTNSGSIEARIPGYKILTAIVTSAPAGYPFALPHNVSSSITTNGALILDPVPLGSYSIQLIDDCGDVFNDVTVTIPAFVNQGIAIDVLQGCDSGKASIKIASNNDNRLTSVRITAAPASSGFVLPFDISNNTVSDGTLYFGGLNSGNYTFNTTDNCGFVSNESLMINGYAVTSSSFSLVANCGSFNIPLNFVDNISGTEVFGLQKLLDATTDSWGNPITGAIYTDGSALDATNSYLLENNATNFNLTFNGVFRIVHQFNSYNNGTDINNNVVTTKIKICTEILSPTLSFNNALAINDVVRAPCSSTGNFDVLLFTSGTPPLHYRIIEKDGIPFIVDNADSNIFLSLTPGIYKFEVEDGCGNSINRTFDVSDLASLVTIYPVCDLFSCATSVTGNETFDLSSQSATILGVQSAADYTLSYHNSQADADNNTNAITNLSNFNPITNPAAIYIRLSFNELPNCYQTGTFNLTTGLTPKINLQPEYVVCDGEPLTLDASPGNLTTTTYSWSNGATTPAITLNESGTSIVTLTSTNSYGSCNSIPLSCETSKEIAVTIAVLPEISTIETHDWTDNENNITVMTTQEGLFEYSLDGINFQESPVFSNLIPGMYTVYVRDTTGCKTVTAEIWLLNYPKFFTPNGDGYNDTWYVKNSENEPGFYVDIYDRYGKLITQIIPNTPGWDGKYNAKILFADDYWFVAHRQDGRTLRGHFALKR